MKVRIPNNGGMADMLRKAQQVQEEMAAKQIELEGREYEISAGGGAVTVKINGKREILDIRLSEEVIDPDDPETLTDILIAAVNEAIKKVDSTQEAEMAKISGQMNIPGMPGMF